MSGNKKPRKQNRQKAVSLHPLTPEDALAGLMKVKPEKEGPMPEIQANDKVKVVSHINKEVEGKIGTATVKNGDYWSVTFNPAVGPTKYTLIEVLESNLAKVED